MPPLGGSDPPVSFAVLAAVLVTTDTGRGRQRWSNRWMAALNAFDIAFDGRLPAGRA